MKFLCRHEGPLSSMCSSFLPTIKTQPICVLLFKFYLLPVREDAYTGPSRYPPEAKQFWLSS